MSGVWRVDIVSTLLARSFAIVAAVAHALSYRTFTEHRASMTGYAALVRHGDAVVERDELRALMPALRRRGPHGECIFTEGPFGAASALLDLGDRRLSPAWTNAGRLLVAGQIRVDAREELVHALRLDGVAARESDPDVQLFARAWSLWEHDAAERLLGDFSAVIHDRETRVTTLVRDSFGVRLLFYHADRERIVASNTLDAVLATAVSRELDDDAIASYLAEGFNDDPATTTFRSVRRVPPGHLLRIHPDGRHELRRYWTLPAPEVDRSRDDVTLVAEFRALLERSVRDRTRSERLTVFMSGGLDSTTLAAIAVRQLGDSSRVLARTAHLPTLAPDEDTERARTAAKALGVPHVLTDVDGYGYREGTAHALPDTAEPCDDPDLLAMRDELQAASAHAPVAFWGEDPDAYLAPPHLADLLRGTSAPRLLLDVGGYTLRHGARPHLGVRDLVRVKGAARARDESESAAWLRPEFRARRVERVRAREDPLHPTRSEAARRLETWHWQPFLESLDAGFHGVPLDVRLPYLDLRLIRFALAVPPIPWLQRKHLLREAARGLIPDSIRLAAKRGLPGVYEARAKQWWSREPLPFEPSDALARYVDVRALPSVDRSSSAAEVRLHLRLRILDRWLRAHSGSG
jgi:asparagine synthase (glutamine-hydrolysing)